MILFNSPNNLSDNGKKYPIYHRLIYRVEGEIIQIVKCVGHYDE